MQLPVVERQSTMKTIAQFSKDGKHRYSLKMVWDDQKPKAAIIMTYPSTADEYTLDQTTMLVKNNAILNEFGGITILNIFSLMNHENPKSDRVNESVMVNVCDEADAIIVAYGRSMSHQERKQEVLNMLEGYKHKLFTIRDEKGRLFAHPLSPTAHRWNIVKYEPNAG